LLLPLPEVQRTEAHCPSNQLILYLTLAMRNKQDEHFFIQNTKDEPMAENGQFSDGFFRKIFSSFGVCALKGYLANDFTDASISLMKSSAA
jgi:hypothetical protein